MIRGLTVAATKVLTAVAAGMAAYMMVLGQAPSRKDVLSGALTTGDLLPRRGATAELCTSRGATAPNLFFCLISTCNLGLGRKKIANCPLANPY